MPAPNNDQNKNEIIQILADDRERNERLLRAFEEAGNAVVRVGRLNSGDYLLDNLLVERKTFSDLCVSIADGRLFRQASRLASGSIQPLIILEGSSADLKASGIKREAIQGALITLALIFRIPVLRSLSPEETAKLIIYASKQIENSYSSTQSYSRPFPGRKTFYHKQKFQSHILQGFQGIGPVLSKRLLHRFGTLSAIFKATSESLAEVKGIGKNAIRRFLEILN